MTPTFCWVFLLALVGRTASVPRPLVVDACALLCNPGAETESERERDPILFPRYPKVNCKLQSDSDEHQAWVIGSHCMKLCNNELSISSEVNCFALRSSLQANLGCYCEALTPLSPNTMRLHESWRLNFLVKELASDILNVILASPLDTLILCEIHQELFKNITLKRGQLVKKCENTENIDDFTTTPPPARAAREVDAEETHTELPSHTNADSEPSVSEEPSISWLHQIPEEITVEDDTTDEATDVRTVDEMRQMMHDETIRHKSSFHPMPEKEDPMFEQDLIDWKRVCKKICEKKDGNKFCQCENPHLRS